MSDGLPVSASLLATIVERQLEIITRLDRLEAKLERIESRQDPDTAKLQALLPAIAAVVGEMGFEVADLKGEVDFVGLTMPQVGLLLKRNRHRVIAGYRIERLRRTNGVGQWTVTAVGDAPQQTTQLVPLKLRKGATG